jgi:hypothetical protein
MEAVNWIARSALCSAQEWPRAQPPEGATRRVRWRPAAAITDPPPVRDHLTEFEGASNAANRGIAFAAASRLLSLQARPICGWGSILSGDAR